ncbi:MAG: Gfo/Idh/MocA family oxidoreductase [Candidatus Sumerlaeota bacterium]|nr:Gfo/Idh/MocA family oxidoreductase [Candidatus Sumerlaeota bacterium]
MPPIARRSFMKASAAILAGAALPGLTNGEPVIPGFDQTKTDYDKTKVWKPFSDRKIRVGLVGYGYCKFSAQFGFQDHPNVQVVAVSDLFPDRCAELSRVVKCPKTYPSLEEMVKDDTIEAIFVATDAPSHARHCIEVLNHGKHVCTAVPALRGDIEDAGRLLDCCKKNKGLVYAMFETSVFHDDLYAMEKIYAAGGFGKIIYSEGEYCHTHTPGDPPLPSYKDWRRNGSPMWYPTHATAYYVGVTHGSFTHVSCQGIADLDPSKREPNAIGNVFTSEIGLFRTREGGLARMMVCPAYGKYLEAGRVRGEIGGYDATYTGCNAGNQIVSKMRPQLKKYALPPDVSPGGHGGSHGYLADDFIDAILRGRKPAVGVIEALNMTVPGYYAHLSAVKDGETFAIPQYAI